MSLACADLCSTKSVQINDQIIKTLTFKFTQPIAIKKTITVNGFQS